VIFGAVQVDHEPWFDGAFDAAGCICIRVAFLAGKVVGGRQASGNSSQLLRSPLNEFACFSWRCALRKTNRSDDQKR
jgi:hypothetical protein